MEERDGDRNRLVAIALKVVILNVAVGREKVVHSVEDRRFADPVGAYQRRIVAERDGDAAKSAVMSDFDACRPHQSTFRRASAEPSGAPFAKSEDRPKTVLLL